MTDRTNKETGAKRVEGKARLKTAAIAMAANKKLHVTDQSGKRGSSGRMKEDTIEKITSDWPIISKEVAQTIIKFYGLPNEATPSQLIWYYNGPWKRTIVHKEAYPHDFPEPHVDMLEQVIDYHVPADRVGLVGQMEGSVIVDRTKGEVAVHCDNEGANILSLNMMHEVVTGKRTPQEAREKISEQITAYLLNRPAPYAEEFQFELPDKEQHDVDETVVQDEVLSQSIQKMKETLSSEE